MKTKHKHLTLENRVDIEIYLTKDYKLKTIAYLLRKDQSTISKEIKLNRSFHPRNLFNTRKDAAIEFNNCQRLKRFPNVCNGCDKKDHCRKDKYYYRAKEAHNTYLDRLAFSRVGVDIDNESFDLIDKIISNGLDKGQSINHILKANEDLIHVSPQTIYRWINEGFLSSGRLDLRKAVRYKPRVKRRPEPTNTGCRENRTYIDYLKFIENNPNIRIVQMDTVEGSRDSKKCLLTLIFKQSSFLYAYLLNAQTQIEVIRALDYIEDVIGLEEFKKQFGCLLCDNGSEFKNPERIEFNKDGERRTWLFYCDPGRSDQKGSLERHHSDIRLFISKGKSFEGLNQKQINKMLNNINSTYRIKLGNTTAYLKALEHFSETTLKKLKMVPINPNKVTLKPFILKK